MTRFMCMILAMVLALGLMACGTQATSSTTAATETAASSLTYKEVGAFIKSQLESQFPYTEITYDETGMTIFLSMDGIDATCYLAQIGTDDPWNNIISSTKELCASFIDAFHSIGCKDYVVSIVISSNQNFDDILAMFLNGEVVYNAAE